jgi:signal transduction histidine kinase
MIGNAIIFTPGGGSIAIRVEADADRIGFAVSDDGPLGFRSPTC